MCLAKITGSMEPPDPAEREGWKVVNMARSGLPMLPYYNVAGRGGLSSEALEVNEWLKAAPTPIRSEGTGEQYITGFHIFQRIEDAMQWSHGTHAIKVKYRGTSYEGMQSNGLDLGRGARGHGDDGAVAAGPGFYKRYLRPQKGGRDMCLNKLTKTIDEPTPEELTGYKVVFIKNQMPAPAYYMPNGKHGDCSALPVNEWLKATRTHRF